MPKYYFPHSECMSLMLQQNGMVLEIIAVFAIFAVLFRLFTCTVSQEMLVE